VVKVKNGAIYSQMQPSSGWPEFHQSPRLLMQLAAGLGKKQANA